MRHVLFCFCQISLKIQAAYKHEKHYKDNLNTLWKSAQKWAMGKQVQFNYNSELPLQCLFYYSLLFVNKWRKMIWAKFYISPLDPTFLQVSLRDPLFFFFMRLWMDITLMVRSLVWAPCHRMTGCHPVSCTSNCQLDRKTRLLTDMLWICRIPVIHPNGWYFRGAALWTCRPLTVSQKCPIYSPFWHINHRGERCTVPVLDIPVS